MQIAHIFNEIDLKNENNIFYDPMQFDVEYIDNIINKKYTTKIDKKDILTNSDNLYYNALTAVEDKSIIAKYDEDKLNDILDALGEDILMISGDFWGIQKFIFNDLTTKKASKILRSRSAMVELITYVVVDILKQEFNAKEVLFGAGKFMVLAKIEEDYEEKIKNIQKELDNYFLINFFGQNGFVLSYQKTSKEKLLNQDSLEMKDDLINLQKNNELKKLNKFNLIDIEEEKININVFSGAKSDDEICNFCKKRAKSIVIESDSDKEKACEVCYNQIILGEKLTKNRYVKIFTSKNQEKKDNVLIFKYNNDFYYAKFFNKIDDDLENVFDISNNKYDGIAKWPLGAFVAKKDNKIKSFEELQETSIALMALKADVDRLGKTFREFYMTSFKKFNRLSRELNFFFSNYVPYFIENTQEYKDKVYVIFSGGDDLFIIGEYKSMVKLTKDLRERFYKFSLQKATLSFGLTMFKHSTPINYISQITDDAEKRAKEVKKNNEDRNGIDIFKISMKFDTFLDIEKKWQEIEEELEEKDLKSTTLYYRLLEFCDMREYILNNPKNAMWRSKLKYLKTRNLDKLSDENYKKLVELIDNYAQKLKPFIYLSIYAKREKSNKGE
jgi:CRISPR-associated protein Csm1